MENGAKGASVSVSGKLRAQRAKTMKFADGYMISSGHPVKEYIDSACKLFGLWRLLIAAPCFTLARLSIGSNLRLFLCRLPREAATGCPWYQGEDYASARPDGQDRAEGPSSRFCHRYRTEGRDIRGHRPARRERCPRFGASIDLCAVKIAILAKRCKSSFQWSPRVNFCMSSRLKILLFVCNECVCSFSFASSHTFSLRE